MFAVKVFFLILLPIQDIVFPRVQGESDDGSDKLSISSAIESLGHLDILGDKMG